MQPNRYLCRHLRPYLWANTAANRHTPRCLVKVPSLLNQLGGADRWGRGGRQEERSSDQPPWGHYLFRLPLLLTGMPARRRKRGRTTFLYQCNRHAGTKKRERSPRRSEAPTSPLGGPTCIGRHIVNRHAGPKKRERQTPLPVTIIITRFNNASEYTVYFKPNLSLPGCFRDASGMHSYYYYTTTVITL